MTICKFATYKNLDNEATKKNLSEEFNAQRGPRMNSAGLKTSYGKPAPLPTLHFVNDSNGLCLFIVDG